MMAGTVMTLNGVHWAALRPLIRKSSVETGEATASATRPVTSRLANSTEETVRRMLPRMNYVTNAHPVASANGWQMALATWPAITMRAAAMAAVTLSIAALV